MSAPTPLVTASRDALADALRKHNRGVITGGELADALLASGVVRAVDGLAEDEALWTRLWEAVADVRDAKSRLANDADTADIVEAALRALTAALAAPSERVAR